MTYPMWNPDRTGILYVEDGNVVFVETGAKFDALVAAGVNDYVEEGDPEPTLEELRAQMQCSPAQMRIALHRAGLLAQVQALADADPEALIVWEYATVITRASPFIAALRGDTFTEEQIDDLFAVASTVSL